MLEKGLCSTVCCKEKEKQLVPEFEGTEDGPAYHTWVFLCDSLGGTPAHLFPCCQPWYGYQ